MQNKVRFACFIELNNMFHKLYLFSSNYLNFIFADVLLRLTAKTFVSLKSAIIIDGSNYTSI